MLSSPKGGHDAYLSGLVVPAPLNFNNKESNMSRRKKYQIGTIIGSGVLSLASLITGVWLGPDEGTVFLCESLVFSLAFMVTLFSMNA